MRPSIPLAFFLGMILGRLLDLGVIGAIDEQWIPSPIVKRPGAFVVVVEESSQRSPATARVLADQEYWDSLEGRELRWRVYDIDRLQSKRRDYADKAKEVGLPALLVIHKDKVVWAGNQPPTTAAINDVVTKATGQ